MLQELLSRLKTYLASDYLRYAWCLLVFGYAMAYAIAYLIARAGHSDKTLLCRCRRAWAIALIFHALVVAGTTIKWITEYGYFPSFWLYFPWYIGMLLIDGFVIVASLSSADRFTTYEGGATQ